MNDARHMKKSSERGNDGKLIICPCLRSKSGGRVHKHKTENRHVEETDSSSTNITGSVSTTVLEVDYPRSSQWSTLWEDRVHGDTRLTKNCRKTFEKQYAYDKQQKKKKVGKFHKASFVQAGLESQFSLLPETKLFPVERARLPQSASNVHRSLQRVGSRTNGHHTIDRMFVDIMKILVSLDAHKVVSSLPSPDCGENELKASRCCIDVNYTENKEQKIGCSMFETIEGIALNRLSSTNNQMSEDTKRNSSSLGVIKYLDTPKTHPLLCRNENDEYECVCCVIKNQNRCHDNNNCHYAFDDAQAEYTEKLTALRSVESSRELCDSTEDLNLQKESESDIETGGMKESTVSEMGLPLQKQASLCMKTVTPSDQHWTGSASSQHKNRHTNCPVLVDVNSSPQLLNEQAMHNYHYNDPLPEFSDGIIMYSNSEHSLQRRNKNSSDLLSSLDIAKVNTDYRVLNSSRSVQHQNRYCLLESSSTSNKDGKHRIYSSTQNTQEKIHHDDDSINETELFKNKERNNEHQNCKNICDQSVVNDQLIDTNNVLIKEEMKHVHQIEGMNKLLGSQSSVVSTHESVESHLILAPHYYQQTGKIIAINYKQSEASLSENVDLETRDADTDLATSDERTNIQHLNLVTNDERTSIQGHLNLAMSDIRTNIPEKLNIATSDVISHIPEHLNLATSDVISHIPEHLNLTTSDARSNIRDRSLKLAHSSEKTIENFACEDLDTYFEYANPVISSGPFGKMKLIHDARTSPLTFAASCLGKAKAAISRARTRSLSPLVTKLSGAFGRFHRAQAAATKSWSSSGVIRDSSSDDSHLMSNNVHPLASPHSNMNNVILNTSEFTRSNCQVDQTDRYVTNRVPVMVSDDCPPTFCLEIVNAGSARKKCKQMFRNQESYSSVMSKEFKNQQINSLTDIRSVEKKMTISTVTPLLNVNKGDTFPSDLVNCENTESAPVRYIQKELEFSNRNQSTSFDRGIYKNSQQKQDQVIRNLSPQDRHVATSTNFGVKSLLLLPILESVSAYSYDPIDEEDFENYDIRDDLINCNMKDGLENYSVKDDTTCGIDEPYCTQEINSIILNRAVSDEQTYERKHNLHSLSSHANCQRESAELSLNDERILAAVGKSCSMMNTNEAHARAESRVSEAMAIISEEVHIKRYPSFPDLTYLGTQGIDMLSMKASVHNRQDEIIKIASCPNRDFMRSQVGHLVCNPFHVESCVTTHASSSECPLKITTDNVLQSLTHLPQIEEYDSNTQTTSIIEELPIFDSTDTCVTSCHATFSCANVQKLPQSMLTSTSFLADHAGSDSQKVCTDLSSSASSVSKNQETATNIFNHLDLPSPPDHTLSEHSYDNDTFESRADDQTIDQLELTVTNRLNIQSTSKLTSTFNLAVSDNKLKLLRGAISQGDDSIRDHKSSEQTSILAKSDVLPMEQN